MVRAHYHVNVGMGGGYLPYGDEPTVFTNRRDAESYAAGIVRARRHDWDIPEVWYGNARDGYVRKSRDAYDLGEYVEVARCTYPECTEAEEGE